MALFQQAVNDGYKALTTKDLVKLLEENQVPYAEINERNDVIHDPQIVAMEALTEFDHPQGGRMRQPRPTGQFSGTPTEIFRCSPRLGEHTDEILEEFGFGRQEIENLHEQGVVDPSTN